MKTNRYLLILLIAISLANLFLKHRTAYNKGYNAGLDYCIGELKELKNKKLKLLPPDSVKVKSDSNGKYNIVFHNKLEIFYRVKSNGKFLNY